MYILNTLYGNREPKSMSVEKQTQLRTCIDACKAHVADPRNTGENSSAVFRTYFQSLLDMQKGNGASTH